MNFSNKTDAEILAYADPFLDNIINASNELDYQKFSKDLSKTMKGAFAKCDFIEQQMALQEKVGDIDINREFVRCIRRQQGVSILWVTHFEKIDGEVLAAIRMDEENGQMKILAARIS
ncbi:MAG: hypothetical protein MJK04_37980 [Psychrosphaera sp.]|nr:hypothetical protein [Psychrosphaera sp.]